MMQTNDDILFNRVRDLGYCDVLIDPSAGAPPADESLEAPSPMQTPLLDRQFQARPAAAPRLIRLDSAYSPLLRDYLAQAHWEATTLGNQLRSVAGLIFSPLPQAELAQHLTRMLDLYIEGLGGAYFRYFDPRILCHLPRILTPTQQALLLHGIDEWGWLDWQGAYQPLHPPNLPIDPAARLIINQAQWQALGEIEAFNLLLGKLMSRGRIPDHQQVPQWLECLQQGRQRGLRQANDIADWAALCLIQGDTWQAHPQLGETLQLVITDGIPLKDALEDRLGITLAPIPVATDSDD
ncbi:hypothetical protein HNQ59_003888 [Chitinivorax tropicus]|uniref:DUF4123 domain-containing protein n=1 Tax=Chitinivorax tropicus TaxID=714531 RepID=A0A840MTK6_9PROT|nr:DUF4123 domain-containing protein [Chitinivorax tropicus]MBB5020567.1 hypothetical protein [Chitinivorax tropicus]